MYDVHDWAEVHRLHHVEGLSRAAAVDVADHGAPPASLSGLAHEIAHLRTALEAVADNVRRHEEQLRRLERRAGRKTG